MPVKLIGIRHTLPGPGEQRRYMREGSLALFTERVVPTLSNESVIIVESRFKRTPVRSGDPEYEEILAEYCPPLFESRVRPTFVLPDPVGKWTYDKYCAHERQFIVVTDFLEEHLEISDVPSDWDRFLDRVKTAQYHFRLRQEPSAQVRQFARNVFHTSQKRNKAFMDAALRFVDQQVILLVGWQHALSVYSSSGWPIQVLTEDSDDVRRYYSAWVMNEVVLKDIA